MTTSTKIAHYFRLTTYDCNSVIVVRRSICRHLLCLYFSKNFKFFKRLTPDNHKQWGLVKLGMLYPNMWVLG